LIAPIDNIAALNEIWRAVLPDEVTRWAIFKYGTTVLCHEEGVDPREHALQVLREHGPVVAGTPLGDFTVGLAGLFPGWVVVYSHPDIGTYVSPDEMESEEPPAIDIGYYGRSKRHEDFLSLEIIHVEQ
jgi:hypothetical protein